MVRPTLAMTVTYALIMVATTEAITVATHVRTTVPTLAPSTSRNVMCAGAIATRPGHHPTLTHSLARLTRAARRLPGVPGGLDPPSGCYRWSAVPFRRGVCVGPLVVWWWRERRPARSHDRNDRVIGDDK